MHARFMHTGVTLPHVCMHLCPCARAALSVVVDAPLRTMWPCPGHVLIPAGHRNHTLWTQDGTDSDNCRAWRQDHSSSQHRHDTAPSGLPEMLSPQLRASFSPWTHLLLLLE